MVITMHHIEILSVIQSMIKDFTHTASLWPGYISCTCRFIDTDGYLYRYDGCIYTPCVRSHCVEPLSWRPPDYLLKRE